MGSKHSAAATPARRAPARQPVRSKAKPVRRRVKPDANGDAYHSPEERQDWLDAESEIDAAFSGRNTSPDMV